MGGEIVAIIIFAYIAVTTVAAVFFGRKRVSGAEDFFVGSQKLGAFEIFAIIYAGSLGIGSTIGIAQFGFLKGISASWWEIAGDFMLVLVAVGFVKFLRMYAKFTVSEIVRLGFGVKTSAIASLVMALGLFTMSVAQLIGGSSILVVVLGVPLQWALLLTTLIVVVTLVLGGMRGMGYANMFHTTISIIGTLTLLGFCLWWLGGLDGLVSKLPATYFDWGGLGVSETTAWILAQCLRFFASATMIQAILSAKDTKTAVIGTTAGSLGMLVVGVSSVLIGMSSRALWPHISSMHAESYAALQLPPIIGGLVLGGIFASITGTVTVYWLTSSTLLTVDVYGRIFHKEAVSARSLAVVRAIIMAMAVLAVILALYPQPYILHLNITGVAIRVIVTILVMFALFKSLDPLAGLAGLIGGVACTVAWIALGEPFQVNRVFVSALSTLLFIIMGHGIFATLKSRSREMFWNKNLEAAIRTVLAENPDLKKMLINRVLAQAHKLGKYSS